MSYSHFPNFLKESEFLFRQLIVEMVDCNEIESEILYKNFIAGTNLNFSKENSSKDINTKSKILLTVYNSIINNIIDYINICEPKFFYDAAYKIKTYYKKNIDIELNKLPNNFNKCLIKKYHINNKTMQEIAVDLQIEKEVIADKIKIESDKLYTYLKTSKNLTTKNYNNKTNSRNKLKDLALISNLTEDAKHTIYNRYKSSLLFFITKIVGNEKKAEIIVNEVFEIAFKNIEKYNSNINFSAWLYKIAINYTAKFIGKTKESSNYKNGSLDKNNDKKYTIFDTEFQRGNKPENFVDISIRNYYKSIIKNLNRNLSNKYGNYLEMKYVNDLSAIEISKLINKSIYYVRAQIVKAERKAFNSLNAKITSQNIKQPIF